jgi:hypothetical protein
VVAHPSDEDLLRRMLGGCVESFEALYDRRQGGVYRDAAGRTRREMKIDSVGPVAVEGGPKQVVFINDWVARAHYVLGDAQRVARKLPLPEPSHFSAVAIPGADENSLKVESLGKRLIEGVEAEGTRAVITVPAGRVGNDRPLEFVSERWYSPELQLVVLSIHKDPYVGDNVEGRLAAVGARRGQHFN